MDLAEAEKRVREFPEPPNNLTVWTMGREDWAAVQAVLAELDRLRTENAGLRKALDRNLCPECEAIDEEDAWGENA